MRNCFAFINHLIIFSSNLKIKFKSLKCLHLLIVIYNFSFNFNRCFEYFRRDITCLTMIKIILHFYFLHLVYIFYENITFYTVQMHLHFNCISLLLVKHKLCENLHSNSLICDFVKIQARKIVATL